VAVKTFFTLNLRAVRLAMTVPRVPPETSFSQVANFLSSRGQIRLIGDGDTTQSAGTVYDIVALKSEME